MYFNEASSAEPKAQALFQICIHPNICSVQFGLCFPKSELKESLVADFPLLVDCMTWQDSVSYLAWLASTDC